MKHRPTPGELVILGAGAALVLASFLEWFRLPSSVPLSGFESRGYNAWARGFSPIAAMPAMIGFLLAVEVAWVRLADLPVPERLLGLTWHQARAVAAAFAVVIMLGELATDNSAGPTSLERGLGLWLSLAGSVSLVAGVAMTRVTGDAAQRIRGS